MPHSSSVDRNAVYISPIVVMDDNGTYVAAPLDSSKFSNGMSFCLLTTIFNTGAMYLRFQHSDANNGSGLEYVDRSSLIYGRNDGKVPYTPSPYTFGRYLPCEGLIGTKRYIYPTVIHTDHVTTVSFYVLVVGELQSIPGYRSGQWESPPV